MLPGEQVATALIMLITEVVKGQPPEVKAKLWELYIEDVREWRKFWGVKTGGSA